MDRFINFFASEKSKKQDILENYQNTYKNLSNKDKQKDKDDDEELKYISDEEVKKMKDNLETNLKKGLTEIMADNIKDNKNIKQYSDKVIEGFKNQLDNEIKNNNLKYQIKKEKEYQDEIDSLNSSISYLQNANRVLERKENKKK
jgi:membrane-associated HD superfamily phosphohydrolase